MNVTRNRDNSRKHCDNSGWPQRDSAEHKEYAGVLTDSGITENNITNADRPEGGLLEEILAPSNLNQAYRVPQGGPLSPLCGNILLNELDWELERRGHRFVRYADDMLIFCKSKRAAERTLNNLILFIERKLFLKVNREKTEVACVGKVKFLGYAFYINKNRDVGLRVHPKSVTKMKAKIRLITARSNGMGYEQRKLKLKQFISG